MALDPIEVGYNTFDHYIYEIVRQIETSGQTYDVILAPSRGGLIPGVCLSHQLKVPLYPLQYSTRDHNSGGRNQQAMNRLDTDWVDYQGPMTILLVEDIIDSGKTTKAITVDIREIFGQAVMIDVATLVYNVSNEAGIRPTYFGMKFDKEQEDRWVNFWWEKVL